MIQLMMYDVGCFLCVFFIFMIAFQFAFLVLFAGVRGSVFQTNQNWGDVLALDRADTTTSLRGSRRERRGRRARAAPIVYMGERSSCSTSRSRRERAQRERER